MLPLSHEKLGKMRENRFRRNCMRPGFPMSLTCANMTMKLLRKKKKLTPSHPFEAMLGRMLSPHITSC